MTFLSLSRSARRRAAALALALALLPQLVVRDRGHQAGRRGPVTFERLAVDPAATAGLGPFRLVGAWHISSRDSRFGGYSALVARPDGHLLALSDRGSRLTFAEPAAAPGPAHPVVPRIGPISPDPADRAGLTDAEAATTGPSGELWVTWEDRRAFSRFSADMTREWRIIPRELKGWAAQFGGEALVRLADGRFLVVGEGFLPRSHERLHDTLIFPSDPTVGTTAPNGPGTVAARHGRLVKAAGYRPTDMALLPDGRVLILLRQLVWPLPMRFSGRIALADPAELDRTGRWHARDVAVLDQPFPSENYEGLAVRPRPDGKLDVWLISDDNRAATQRTLLIRLMLDPQDLPLR